MLEINYTQTFSSHLQTVHFCVSKPPNSVTFWQYLLKDLTPHI